MVHMSSLGTPKRHPESGIFWFRKRVPDRLKSLVGKSEVKLSLRTRDLGIARIKYLETSLQIERDWAQLTNPLIGAATLQFAVDQDMLSNNPAAGILVRVKDTLHERDKGFSGEEARTILAATLRRPSDKISVEMAAARRWVPWIRAYMGARVNEITPLTGRDFLQRDGIPMLRIRAETNKTRKFRLLDERGDNRLGVLACHLGQHHVTGMTLDQGRDVGVVRPGQEIALPMTRHRPIFNRRRSLTD